MKKCILLLALFALALALTTCRSAPVTDLTTEYDWGITLTARDVTPTGLTLTISRSDAEPIRIVYGIDYLLEVLGKNGWESLPVLKERAIWTDGGFLVPEDGSAEQQIDWTWLYGPLPPGTYRICKRFTHSGDAPKPIEQRYAAEFQIS